MQDDLEPPNRLRNISPLVLLAAIPSIAMGVLLLAVSESVAGLFWYGIAITLGGLALLGFWLHWRRRGDANHPFGVYPTSKLPGKWYPLAIGVIMFALGLLMIYIRKR